MCAIVSPPPGDRTAITPYRLLTDIEIENLPPPEWLIADLVPCGALVVLYGEPGIGKTFLALDWAMSIAAGRPWLGRTVRQGHVLYLAYEGSAGFGPRVRAWKVNGSVVGQTFPIHFLTDAPPITHKELPRLAYTIAAVPHIPLLIVVDTFARALDGDENSAKDVGDFIKIMDGLRQQAITVLLIHHSGKNPEAGERGSTALRGAADTIMSLSRSPYFPLMLECRKQKDAQQFAAIGLELTAVGLGNGQQSCVVSERVITLSLDGLAPVERRALETLRDAAAEGLTSTAWREATEIPEGTFQRVRRRLEASGFASRPGLKS